MNLPKNHRKLADVIAPFGLTYVQRGSHYGIVDGQGHFVASVASTPSDMHFARQTIRHLVRDGILPQELRKVKF